ncbi:glycosyltransferase family 4 protein, partial [Methylophaga sp. UBA1464]
EAMAADLPIICTDCGGGAEIIDGIGQLFKFRDIDALSDALIKTANVETSIANKQAINSRLETLFSDSAVKQAFWSNSRISRLLNA